MKKIFSEKIIRVLKNKKKLEELLDVKIENRGKEIYISGSAENEYVAEKVIEALDFGFPFSDVILLKKGENFIFDIINIKEYANKKNLESIRARIIGKKGKCLSTLKRLTNCSFEIKNNFIGILGKSEEFERASAAIISIIKGSKHANVYKFLEKNQYQIPDDLGLKEYNNKL
jgi:ribosomal RNA assembly protein